MDERDNNKGQDEIKDVDGTETDGIEVNVNNTNSEDEPDETDISHGYELSDNDIHDYIHQNVDANTGTDVIDETDYGKYAEDADDVADDSQQNLVYDTDGNVVGSFDPLQSQDITTSGSIRALQPTGVSVSPSTYSNGKINYRKRKISLIPFINEFQRDFTTSCFKRTTPYHYTLPFSFMRILLSVNALCKGDNATEAKKLGEVLGFLTKPDGGGLKTGDSIRKDLCKMTADPFPLLESAKDKYKGEMKGKEDYYSVPLYSISDGLYGAERYSKVGLSLLGKLAVGRYYNLYKTDIKKIKQIKTLVPIALLRKKTTPWTLGHKTVNYGYNPRELFMLQARMLDYMIDHNVKEPYLALSDSDVAEIFKGPDVGNGYIGYMTNTSLMSLYHLGVGSFTVVPDIKIDRTAKTIEFAVPPLGMTSLDFVDYLNFRWAGKNAETGKLYPKFKTFDFPDPVELTGIRVVVRNVKFLKTDEEIIDEFYADPIIRVTSPLNNTVLVGKDKEGNTKVTSSIGELEADVSDVALDNFVADVMPIHELLWQHVQDEFEVRCEEIEHDLAKLREQLEVDLFLEKVTRPDVARYIGSMHTLENDKIFRDILYKKFSPNSSEFDEEMLPEGFLNWEIDEIVRESASGGRTGLNILAIMYKRGKYEHTWKDTQNKIQRLEDMLNNPAVIYGQIREDLTNYANVLAFRRKTKMYFIEEVRESENQELEYTFNFNNAVWDKLDLPCTVFHNGRYLAKSYGRNINVIRKSQAEEELQFTHSLNCTNKDKIYVFTREGYELFDVNTIPSKLIDFEYIHGIVPYSEDKEILVLLETKTYDKASGNYEYDIPRYFTIPAGGLHSYFKLLADEHIKGWCYLDKKYVEFLGFSTRMGGMQTYGRIPSEDIVRSNKPTFLPMQFETVTDIQATDNEGKEVALLSNEFNGSILNKNALFAKWPQRGESNVLNLINVDVEFAEVFSTHIDFYADNLYMTDWKKINLVSYEYITRSKKSVINEVTWCRPNDAISIQYDSMISRKADLFRRKLSLVVSANTDAYDMYKIGNLEDWSVINPRFQLPTVRPKNPEHIKFYEEYLNKMFTCKVSSKEFKSIAKEMETVRAGVIKESGYNPFIKEVQVAVPDLNITTDTSVTSESEE